MSVLFNVARPLKRAYTFVDIDGGCSEVIEVQRPLLSSG